MAGSPIKRARREIREQSLLRAAAIDQAILDGYERGIDPVVLMMPVAAKVYRMAVHGDPENPVTLAACKEVLDGVAGKMAQEVSVDALGLDDLEDALVAISERRRARALEAQRVPEIDVTPASGTDG